MRKLGAWLAFALCVTAPGKADSIFQTTAQGKLVIYQRDAIVVHEDPSYIVYKHFELKERRVTKVRLNKTSLPYRVERSDKAERQRIIEIWKRFGYKVTLTDVSGKSTQLFDVYLDFYPPGGRGSLLESVPPRTSFPLLMEGGGADEFEFDKVTSVEINGDAMKVTLREGRTATGKFLMPTSHPAEVRIMGITDHYDPSSDEVFDFGLALEKVREIRFE